MSDQTLLLIDRQTFNHLLAGVRALQVLHRDDPIFAEIIGDDPLDNDQLDTLAENLNTSFFEPTQAEMLRHFSDPSLRHYADQVQTDDDLEVDDHPIYSPTDNGCWVSAWIFIKDAEEDVQD